MIKKIKQEKWYKKNLITPEEKRRGYKIHKQQTKKYRGIEYNLICLESISGRKWVVLESKKTEFPKDLLYNLDKYHFTDEYSYSDFLWYDSGFWDKKPIKYQWKKMDQIAKRDIDKLYKIYQNREIILNDQINHLKNTLSNLEKFIDKIKGDK